MERKSFEVTSGDYTAQAWSRDQGLKLAAQLSHVRQRVEAINELKRPRRQAKKPATGA